MFTFFHAATFIVYSLFPYALMLSNMYEYLEGQWSSRSSMSFSVLTKLNVLMHFVCYVVKKFSFLRQRWILAYGFCLNLLL